MSILTQNAPVATTLTALAMLIVLAPSCDLAQAASNKAQKSAEVVAAAKKFYEDGVKAYQAGRHQNAVDQLSSALRGGGLNTTEMARGLYYRGLSYKKLDKPGLAISDLTSALWLKNGLSEDERKMATAERAEAYKAAGLGDGNSGADRVAASDPKSETPAPAPAPAAEPATAAMPAATAATTNTSTPSAWGEGVPQPLTMGAETAAVPPPPNTVRQTSPSGTAALQQAAVGTDSPAQSDTGGGAGGIGAFFSNLFSSGSSSSPETPAAGANSVTTASTTQATPETSNRSDDASPAQVNAKTLSPEAKTAAAKPAAPASIQPPSPAPAKVAKAQTKGGKYKLHIAALRSRAAAEALAQKLMQEHATDLHDRQPTVDEAVIGSMGTFYRVRVGSYKTAEEPRGLCNTLRNSGYDCLVVSN